MVTKVVINNNEDTPIGYLHKLKAFKNGKTFEFKKGVNIIVGANGCGKTTLMNLIRKYLLVDLSECSAGTFNCNINELFPSLIDHSRILDGVEVFADYQRNTFRLCHAGERKHDDEILADEHSIQEFFGQKWASTGEGVLQALNAMFGRMFGKGAKLAFNYAQFASNYPQYIKYVAEHAIEGDEWTVLMDEPDRNLDIENISQIKGILSFHKPHTQIIAVVHNPLLIYSLSNNPDVNIIEMTKGYVNKIKKQVNGLLK